MSPLTSCMWCLVQPLPGLWGPSEVSPCAIACSTWAIAVVNVSPPAAHAEPAPQHSRHRSKYLMIASPLVSARAHYVITRSYITTMRKENKKNFINRDPDGDF